MKFQFGDRVYLEIEGLVAPNSPIGVVEAVGDHYATVLWPNGIEASYPEDSLVKYDKIMAFFTHSPILDHIRTLKIEDMSPAECMTELYHLRRLARDAVAASHHEKANPT